jgi:hypothetical protein
MHIVSVVVCSPVLKCLVVTILTWNKRIEHVTEGELLLQPFVTTMVVQWLAYWHGV